MDKKEKKGERKEYVKPQIDIIKINTDSKILAVSPPVEPGNGFVTVVPPDEDENDTELSGAKRYDRGVRWDE